MAKGHECDAEPTLHRLYELEVQLYIGYLLSTLVPDHLVRVAQVEVDHAQQN